MSKGRVIVAMSGGVDSSVAALLLKREGYEVIGVTMRLWALEREDVPQANRRCCSVEDVEDARRVCSVIGAPHYFQNFEREFQTHVVDYFVQEYDRGRTPHPCLACNDKMKFDFLLRRAMFLDADYIATGHYARIRHTGSQFELLKGIDGDKDQSYVLHMLDQDQLASLLLPIGDLTKDEVRQRAADLGLRTADKPDSQDVCFITREHGREDFLRRSLTLTPGRVVDGSGAEVGSVAAVELVTVGQRRGMALAGGAAPRFAVDVDVAGATVTVGSIDDLMVDATPLEAFSWADGPVVGRVLVQTSAHGSCDPAVLDDGVVLWAEPRPRVAPGQSVVFYDGDQVLGGSIARRA